MKKQASGTFIAVLSGVCTKPFPDISSWLSSQKITAQTRPAELAGGDPSTYLLTVPRSQRSILRKKLLATLAQDGFSFVSAVIPRFGSKVPEILLGAGVRRQREAIERLPALSASLAQREDLRRHRATPSRADRTDASR